MAAALLAYEGSRDRQRPALSIARCSATAPPATRHALEPGEVIESIALRPARRRAGVYRRAIGRTHAEWPLVEICARAVVADGTFRVSPPRRRRHRAGAAAPDGREAPLQGGPRTRQRSRGREPRHLRCQPLPMTGYKLALMEGLIRDLLERLVG